MIAAASPAAIAALIPAAVLTAAVLAAPAAGARALPDCAALRAWGAEDGAAFSYAPGVDLPGFFAPGATAPLFGAPVTDWTAEDARALDKALAACARDARKARDTAATEDFKALAKALAAASRALKNADQARGAAAKALTAIDAGPQTPQLLTDLAALAATDAATLKDFRTNLRDIGAVARALPLLPEAEGAALRAALAQRAEALGEAMGGARVAALADAPETPLGVLQARAAAFDARREMGAAAAPVVAAAEARETAILAALAVQSPAPVAPPACGAYLGWAAAVDASAARRTRAGAIMAAFEAPEVAALFGKPFADWSPDDAALLGPLTEQCRGAARAGLLDGDRRTLEQAASRAAGLAQRAGEQQTRRAALAAARAEADRIIAEAAAAAEGAEGFAALAALEAEAARAAPEPEDAARVAASLAARREALTVAALAAPRADIAAAPATLAGMAAVKGAFTAVAQGPLRRWIAPEALRQFQDEARARLEALAPGAAPDFEAAVAALPADADGLRALDALARATIASEAPAWDRHRAAVAARREAIAAALVAENLPKLEAELAALPETREGFQQALVYALTFERSAATEAAAFATYADRAAARAEALRATLAAARCAPVLDAAGVSAKHAAAPVLAGDGVTTLGRLVCALAKGAPRHDGPGLFGGDHTVAFTGAEGFLMKITLHEAEVKPGVRALIGKRIDDPNGGRDISAAEWVGFVGMATDIGGADACAARAGRVSVERLASGTTDDAAMQALTDCLLARPEAAIRPSRSG